ncbi:peptidase S8/S53 domain-containing protein [Aspergillus alliaceus]|uniref:peptidase S8/S53 domain-containing protein n=1 Tax=Petromyces alliaceus TaxID=209559 RepID=UPI0012A55648|nr:peptidase S8/S53 domain-containing protein [Aspergillus alliaceus]KAB8237450.1 peptidase S8/S53 domain-containing protein [Aspergillus alliaceus]
MCTGDVTIATANWVQGHPRPIPDFSTMHNSIGTPTGWRIVKRAHPSEPITIRIYLHPSNITSLQETVYAIATPGNEQYGKHLSREDTHLLSQPSVQAIEDVTSWITGGGISLDKVKINSNRIKISTTIGKANGLLRSDYSVFEHQGFKRRLVRSLTYNVPADVREHIAMLQPVDLFPPLQAHVSRGRKWSDNRFWEENQVALGDISCNHNITPSCLKDLYNIDYTADGARGGKVAFTSFLGEAARHEDVKTFQEQLAPWTAGHSYQSIAINGAENEVFESEAAAEGNLDGQYFIAIVAPLPMTEYNFGGRGPLIPDLDQPSLPGSNEPYLEFLEYLLDLPDKDLPHTITSSYGENEQEIPPDYAQAICNLFALLGARGVSMIVSSGDSGVGQACQSNDGHNTTRFNPIFPASCPFVTSVGATKHVYPEVAVEFSSGGFSDLFPRPSYQDAAVQQYLHGLGDTWAGLYNVAGRGFPDVAAQGTSFTVVDKGRESHISGTSAAAPVFAGIVALISAERVTAGLPPLGFLNPWLYSEGFRVLNDVTRGGSDGCNGVDQYSKLETPVVPFASWNATVGWDPVTGLGTPDYGRMRGLFINGALGL